MLFKNDCVHSRFLTWCLTKELHPLVPIARCQHTVPYSLQDLPEEGSDLKVVVND